MPAGVGSVEVWLPAPLAMGGLYGVVTGVAPAAAGAFLEGRREALRAAAADRALDAGRTLAVEGGDGVRAWEWLAPQRACRCCSDLAGGPG